MDVAEAATKLGRDGFAVFRAKPMEKSPAFNGWQDEATSDLCAIHKLFNGTPFNVGIYTGRFGSGGALLVLDLDVKNGKNGVTFLLEYCVQRELSLSRTRKQTTPSGGVHLIYRVPHAVASSTNLLGSKTTPSGVDIR